MRRWKISQKLYYEIVADSPDEAMGLLTEAFENYEEQGYLICSYYDHLDMEEILDDQ